MDFIAAERSEAATLILRVLVTPVQLYKLGDLEGCLYVSLAIEADYATCSNPLQPRSRLFGKSRRPWD